MVILARHAGFCFGVKRAVEAVQSRMNDQHIVTLGPLIHNRHVVESLCKAGVRCVESLNDVQPSETVVIRSHGAPPAVYQSLQNNGLQYVDATCPFVKRIHQRVSAARNLGQCVIIIGEAGHPEVDATLGWAGECAYTVNSSDDVEKLPHIEEAVVVAQTTITNQKWHDTLKLLEQRIPHIIPFMSICSATQQRQDEARELAARADTMIVVGGILSSNTRKLVELCQKHCKNVYHIEHKSELLLEKMHLGDIIGIVAGASTPDTIIREVYNYMIDNDKVLPLTDGEDVTAAEQAAASDMADAVEAGVSAADETPDKPVTTDTLEQPAGENEQETVESSGQTDMQQTQATHEAANVDEEQSQEENQESDQPSEEMNNEPATEKEEFLEGLEKVIRLKKGQIIVGTVVQVTDDDVSVNIGYKSDGIIHKNELSLKDINTKETFTIGDEIEAEVISLNDGEGNVLLSRKRIEKKQKWIKMQENVGTDKLYKCTVKKAVKGGVTTRIEGYSTFIPASHLSLKYVEDLKEFEGKELEVTLIDSDKRQQRLVASHKSVLYKEKEQKEKELWESFRKGEQIKGVVKRLTDFGAFVDVGGVDGLLHISDLAWSRVKHPSDVVSEGQEIDVLVLNVDPEKKKIALGYKQLLPKPWDNVDEKYRAGDVVKGKVVRIVPFGAFVQLEPMVDGLVHISQITVHRLEKVEDALRLGDEIEAKVLDVNADKKKISLSIRALLPEEEKQTDKKEKNVREDNFKYEIPPVQEATVSLADFFPKKDE